MAHIFNLFCIKKTKLLLKKKIKIAKYKIIKWLFNNISDPYRIIFLTFIVIDKIIIVLEF